MSVFDFVTCASYKEHNKTKEFLVVAREGGGHGAVQGQQELSEAKNWGGLLAPRLFVAMCSCYACFRKL